MTSSGKNPVHRICTGAGEGEGTARAHAEILRTSGAATNPFVEDVMTTPTRQARTFCGRRHTASSYPARQ